MYRSEQGQMTIYDFIHPFGGNLDSENRWVKMAELVPWSEFENKYAKLIPSEVGNVAKPFRMALGALLVQQALNISDEETVMQITENIYLQFFVGLKEFTSKPPFDSSLMTRFRKRINAGMLNEINEAIYLRRKLGKEPTDKDDNNDSGTMVQEKNEAEPKKETVPENKGKLLLDATCTPADVRYPTDLSLLNEARELLDVMIDHAHAPSRGEIPRPRTQRKTARKIALSVLKKKNPGKQKIRAAVRKMLGCVKRNIRELERVLANPGSLDLTKKQMKLLATIKTLYAQQREMYQEKKHSVPDRIVSIHQPHVRPMVRGKAAAKVEFGAKVEASIVDGYAFVDVCSWNARNESATLKESVEKYYRLHGYYPEAVLADQIYRTRENRQYCKNLSIRLSGPPMGRPKESEVAGQRKIFSADAAERNAVEGKFGEGKRTYGMGKIMARLEETSESVISLQFMVMNLKRLLRVFFVRFFLSVFFRQNDKSTSCLAFAA